MSDWQRLTPGDIGEGDCFSVYTYDDDRHYIGEMYIEDGVVYPMHDTGISLTGAELAALPPVKAKDAAITLAIDFIIDRTDNVPGDIDRAKVLTALYDALEAHE
jgi:hypothetical protein